jgi:hypothetical protein
MTSQKRCVAATITSNRNIHCVFLNRLQPRPAHSDLHVNVNLQADPCNLIVSSRARGQCRCSRLNLTLGALIIGLREGMHEARG